VGVQLGGGAAPGVTPDRSKTFTSGEAGAAADSQASTTQGMPPQLGHLGIVVGLVWRSVVLWMLLVALLKIANLTSLVVF
jgi:adenosylcobinamide-phosphate synthase